MNKDKITAVIFDFDMTLVDSAHAVTECMNMLADEKGMRRVSEDEMRALIGLPLEDEWRKLWGYFEPEWVNYYREKFVDIEFGLIKEYPETREVLASLRESGIKTGVATNRKRAVKALEYVGLFELLDVIVGLEDVKNAKPHTEPVLTAVSRAGSTPATALYAGDTLIDMETALSAGVRGIGMTTGNFGEKELRDGGASWVCSDLREIFDIVKSISGQRG